VAVLAPAPSARAAGPALGVENVRVGFSNKAKNNLFKVGAWTPVWVQLRGGSERFAGTMELVVPDDEGTPTAFRQPVEVGPGDMPHFVTYARTGVRDPDVTVRLFDARGRLAVEAKGDRMSPPVTLDPILPDEALVVTLGRPQGVDQIVALPGYAGDGKNAGSEPMVVAGFDPAAGPMPGRWYGYDAADAVVVETNDRALVEALGTRGQALADWVARGGHLVVAVGGNWQAVRDSALGPLLPAVPNGREQLPSLDAVETFAGSTVNKIMPPGGPKATVTKLEDVEKRGGKVLAATGTVPLIVRGPHGFGRVTLLAFDVDQKPFSDWKDRATFWVKAADLRPPTAGGASNAVRFGGGGRAIVQEGVSDLASQLRQALEQFPGVKLVPFGWVAFFIFLYILLIGPGDYLFLKKVVKRMELTWVTFPLIVVAVSLAAYLAAYAVKGKELRVNKVDVLDVDQASAAAGGPVLARGSSFLNLFSPQNYDYDVAVVPHPIDRPPPVEPETGRGGSGSGSQPAPRAPAGTEVLLSWMGVPEPGFGGMGGGNRVGFVGGGYAYDPPGASERLEGVRVAIWSTKCLTARWFGPSPAVADSDLIPVGSDRLNGTITNRLDVPMNDAIVAFGRQVYELGTLAPGATVRVELARDRHLQGLLGDQSRNYLPGQAWSTKPGGRIDRAHLLLGLMFHDSQKSAGAEPPLPSVPLHYLDLTGQLQLDRPMLVARVDRPAARLVLGSSPSPPKIEQTTMLRVTLPLAKER
jgi:hypothetical protein